MDATVGGALGEVGADAGIAHPSMPHHLAFVAGGIGVERVHVAGLLPGQQQLTAVRQLGHDNRGAEIEIAAGVLRAVGAAVQAGGVPGVPGQRLEAPGQRAAIHVEGDDGIGSIGDGVGQVFTGAYVDAVAFGVHCGGAPHAHPRGAVEITAVAVLSL